MNPATINTILNSAPVIMKAAGKLIALIRDREGRDPGLQEKEPVSLETLQAAIERIEQRLDTMDRSDVEQIQLIEELARQNELLAAVQQRSMQRINILYAVIAAGLCAALLAFWLK